MIILERTLPPVIGALDATARPAEPPCGGGSNPTVDGEWMERDMTDRTISHTPANTLKALGAAALALTLVLGGCVTTTTGTNPGHGSFAVGEVEKQRDLALQNWLRTLKRPSPSGGK